MWSDNFTYDRVDGEKIAIVLLDTQGIFNDESSTKDCTATFAISIMLSSIQCYNVMQTVQEDDLQYLELFTAYARLALQQTNEKPFQNLMFIVRDWPYAQRYGFGDGQDFIDKKLTGNDKQTPEMRDLRNRIRQSFDKIAAFLMPHPGFEVAEGKFTNCDLQHIDLRFIEYVEKLVPSLFAQENLIVKRIGDQKVSARDLITYIEAYVNVFNSDELPEPKSILMVCFDFANKDFECLNFIVLILQATAEASNQIIYDGCLQLYTGLMQSQIDQKSNDEFEPYLVKTDLKCIHEKAKEIALLQVRCSEICLYYSMYVLYAYYI